MTRWFSLALVGLMQAALGLGLTPATDQYVPSVAHAQGQLVNNVRAAWRGDVWVFNPNTTTAGVDMYFLPRGTANPNPEVRHISVDPGETRYLEDIVASQFGLDEAAGALRVVSDIPVLVTGRSYDANVTVEARQRGAGSAGQFFSGIPAASAIALGGQVDVIGLDQDGAGTNGTWRSNLALVETTGASVTLDVQRLDADGTAVGSIPVTLQGREARQLDLILWTIQATPGSNQRVRVSVTAGTGKVVASASRIDNRSGDPSTVDMAGQGLDGVYVCTLDKTTYDTPVTLIVNHNAVSHVEATVLVTDEDSSAACEGGELFHVNQDLNPPAVLEDGSFAFQVSGTQGSATVTMQLVGAIAASTRVAGKVTTAVSGVGACSGSKQWPLVGARLP